jgi:hypothetical protein
MGHIKFKKQSKKRMKNAVFYEQLALRPVIEGI